MPKRGRPARVSKALQIDNEKLSILKTKWLKRKLILINQQNLNV
jgi:hypothetical protein